MKITTHPSSATMKDVAIQAGVSTATVSRAFADSEKVSAKTRQRVESAAHALGYSFAPSFPRLTHQYWRTILVLVADITDSFYSDIIRGIEIQARQLHCLITLFDCAHQSVESFMVHSRGGIENYNGIIFVGLSPVHHDPMPACAGVVINEYSSGHTFPTVHIDNLTAAFDAVQYLIQRGHQRIACLTGPEELAICQYRRQGYLQALQRHNIPLNPYYLARGDFSFASGLAAIEHFLQLATPPDAIFCHNDKMALGVLHRAKQLGIVVPKQLSIIGFDNIEESQYADPPLTTISQPRKAQGEAAVSVLVAMIEGKNITHRSYLLETELILRQSTR